LGGDGKKTFTQQINGVSLTSTQNKDLVTENTAFEPMVRQE
jgi:hypothetical protein